MNKQKLKQQIIDALDLQNITPSDIDDDAPLFREGLGLDSIDALELVAMVEKHHGIRIMNMEDALKAFASVTALAAFIQAKEE